MTPGELVKDLGGWLVYSQGPKRIQSLPRSALLPLADKLGGLIRRMSPEDTAMLAEELAITLGVDAERAHEVIRRAYALRMLVELEVLRYPVLSATPIDRVVTIEGQHHLDAALAHGRGAIVMIGHYGANQLIMPALGYRGYVMNQLSAPPTAWIGLRSDGRDNRLWRGVQERRWGLEQTLPVRHIDVFGFLRPAYSCLARNEVLGLAFDGGGGSRWVEVPLGRRLAAVPTQPWQLARSTGAMVVPGTVVHEPGELNHRVVLDEPYIVESTKERDRDVSDAAIRYADWFSERVYDRPDHYAPYLLLRRKVRFSDTRAFFSDYPVE